MLPHHQHKLTKTFKIAENMGGNCLLKLEDLVPVDKKEIGEYDWLKAFLNYMAVYLEQFPSAR